jgi:hypothetical protein
MHGLVDSEAFDVRPVENSEALPRHLFRVFQGGELDVLRARCRLEALDEITEREADPRDYHRPGFNAPKPIDALLERVGTQQALESQLPRLFAFSIDDDGPWLGAEAMRILRGVFLAGAKFVEVVVARDLGERVRFLRRRVAGALLVLQWTFDQIDRQDVQGGRFRARRGDADSRKARKECPPRVVDRLRRDLGRSDARSAAYGDWTAPGTYLLHQSSVRKPRFSASRRSAGPAFTSTGSSTTAR